MILQLETGNYFRLNQVGTATWEFVQESHTVREIYLEILARYEVDSQRWERDLYGLLEEMREAELIEIKLAAQSPDGIQRRLFDFSMNFNMKPSSELGTSSAATRPPACARGVYRPQRSRRRMARTKRLSTRKPARTSPKQGRSQRCRSVP